MYFLSRVAAGLLIFLLALPIVGCGGGGSSGGTTVNALLNAARVYMVSIPEDDILTALPINRDIIFDLTQLPVIGDGGGSGGSSNSAKGIVSSIGLFSSEGTVSGAGRLQGLAPGQPIRYQYQYFDPNASVQGIGFRFGLAGPIWMIRLDEGAKGQEDGSLSLDLNYPEASNYVDFIGPNASVCNQMQGRCGTFDLYAFAITLNAATESLERSEPVIVSSAVTCNRGVFEDDECAPDDLDCLVCTQPSCQDLIASCNTFPYVQTVVETEVEDRLNRGCFTGTITHTIFNAPPGGFFEAEASWNQVAFGFVGSDGTATLTIPTPLHCSCLEGSVDFFLEFEPIGSTDEFDALFLLCADIE